MKKAVAVIDMQNDFVTGSLGSKAAEALLPGLCRYLEENAGEADVFFTLDTHGADYPETQEGKNLPVPHCIRGTEGWKIAPELRPWFEKAAVFEKPTFGSLGLAQALAAYDEVTFTGVCTDICVISNALLLKAVNPEVKIFVKADLCAGVSAESHEAALSAMRSCQVAVI